MPIDSFGVKVVRKLYTKSSNTFNLLPKCWFSLNLQFAPKMLVYPLYTTQKTPSKNEKVVWIWVQIGLACASPQGLESRAAQCSEPQARSESGATCSRPQPSSHPKWWWFSKGSPPKSLKHSGLGIILIHPECLEWNYVYPKVAAFGWCLMFDVWCWMMMMMMMMLDDDGDDVDDDDDGDGDGDDRWWWAVTMVELQTVVFLKDGGTFFYIHGDDQATCPLGYLFNFLHVTYQPARVLNLLTCCL